MNIKQFELERYFSKYEFSTKYLLSSSDCESVAMAELIESADEECLSLWHNLKMSYTESQGNSLLLNEITKLYSGIKKQDLLQIVPEEGIYIAMRTLIEPGDKVICPFPAYQSLFSIVESQGGIIEKWHPKYKDGWKFDVDELDTLVTDETKMIIINFPHNPTGSIISNKELIQIVNIARRHNCILFSDEMYRFLEYKPANRLPSACELYEKSVTLCGLSKSFSMPGARCGWLITKNREMNRKFAEYKDYTTICACAPSEILSVIALRQAQSLIENNLKIIKTNLSELDSLFSDYKDIFTWKRPLAGPVGYPIVSSEIDVTTLAKRLIEEKNIMILPGSVYFDSTNAFRVGFGRKNLPDILPHLRSFLETSL